MRNFISGVFIFGILIPTSCGKQKKGFAKNTVEYSTALNEHDAMVKYLADLKSQFFDNTSNRFASTFRTNAFLQMPVPDKPGDKLDYYYRVAFEFLSAGNTVKAIELLEQILSESEQWKTDEESKIKLKKLLAICYLRYGEQLNCISNHVSESCILPIASAAIYTEQEATKKAIELYKKLLDDDPNDFSAAYLLNVASMNLGLYPDNVPSEFVISPQKFMSDIQMSKFKNIAMYSGLDVVSTSGGVCTEDFNNDGFIDVIVSSWFLTDQIHFYVNNGDGTFTEKTAEANLTGITGGLNVIHADYNNDGYKDIFILRGAWWADFGKIPNSLLKNNGDGTFSDITKSSGLFSLYPTQSASFADFNNDGWLDLFIGNESRRRSEIFLCELFISNRDGTFTNKAASAHIDVMAFSKGVSAADYDNDGYCDIAISCQGQSNLLLRNVMSENKGVLKFENVSKKAGISGPLKSFPITFLDYNNDGLDDLFIFTYDAKNCDYDNAAYYFDIPVRGEYSAAYQNNGNGSFSNITNGSGIDIPMTAMGLNYDDMDNDGWLDIYVGTGTPEYTSIVPNKMMRNNKGARFQDVTSVAGLGHLQKGHGIGFADFDNDGDQDIYQNMGGGYEGDPFQSAFYENPGNTNAWVTLKLQGVTCNRDAIGAKVILTVELKDGSLQKYYHTVNTGASFGSNSLQLECGLDDAICINKVEVKWPGGELQSWTELPMACKILLIQDNPEPEIIQMQKISFNTTEIPNGHDMSNHSMHE